MRTPAPPAYCRLTVLAPGRRVDVALPADVPLAELVPMVLELIGGPGHPRTATGRPEPWRFTGATGGPLSPDATLEALGVLDGELIRLGPAVPPPPPPVFDDPVDALAALAAPGVGPDRCRRAAVAVLAVALAAAVLLVAAGTGAATHTWAATLVGGAGAVLALARAARVARRGAPAVDGSPPGEPDDAGGAGRAADRQNRTTALVPACCAVPLAAAAGWAALPGPAGAEHLLLAVVAGGVAAALGQVAVRFVAPALIGTAVVAVLTGAAVVVGLRFRVDAPALAAVTGALALSAGPLLPRAALRLAGLPRPVVPADAADLVAADTAPDLLPPDELAERAELARGHLTGLSGGCAVVAAVAAPLAATPHGWAGPALGAVVVTTLGLRARSFADPAPGRVHLTTALAAGLVLVGLAAAAADAAGRLAWALALLAVAGAGAGVLGRRERAASPVARRTVDLAEGVLTAAAVPLALAAAGVFALVRAL